MVLASERRFMAIDYFAAHLGGLGGARKLRDPLLGGIVNTPYSAKNGRIDSGMPFLYLGDLF